MPGFSAATRGIDQNQSDAEFRARYSASNTAPVPFWDAVSRSVDDYAMTRRVGVRQEDLRAMLWERHREVEKRLGRKLALPDSLAGEPTADQDIFERIDPSRRINAWILRQPGVMTDDAYEAELDKLRRENPKALDGIRTRVQMTADLDAGLRRIRARAEEASTGGGLQGAAGGFVGGVAGSFTDPGNAGVALMTGGWGAARPLLSRMAIQTAAGAGVELMQVGDRAADAKVAGPDYTAGEAASDIVLGGIAGGAFELAGAGLKRAIGGLKPPRGGAGARLSEVIDQAVRDEAAVGRQDGETFEAGLDSLERAAPPPRPAAAQDLGDLPFVPAAELGGPEGVTLSAQADYRGQPIYAGRFDPRVLQADPGRFQYKADGDAQGVTARLRGVEAWDATASGKAIVWQDEAGALFVADGHQRRGLALRMLDQGWEDVALDGHLFRAADGWTARQVRTVAALKNIREGSGTILDATKILRDAPEAAADKSLPVTGEFMGQARALSRLSPEAFGAVVNKVIPERYGAEIGQIAGDRPDLHEAMVKLLKGGEPANADEARAMVVEALQDDWIRSEGDQADLFGYDPSVSAMAARAKVAASVKRGLARDAKLFSGLIKHADAIEAGGNALARDANEARLAVDRAALELTAKLALRSGPIGEAMAEAAAKVVKGAAPADAAKGVVSRLRQALKAGERLDDMRGVALAPEPPSPAAKALAEGFDDPAGPAAKGQVEPKPEDAELETAPGRTRVVPEGSRSTVVDSSGVAHPFLGEPLPKRGLVVANLKEDGTIYVGGPRELHFQVMERFPDEDGNGILDTGFVSPDGQYLTRKEAAAWVSEYERPIKPSENMDGGLDAMDYREQVPASAQYASPVVDAPQPHSLDPPPPREVSEHAVHADERDAPDLFGDIMPEVGAEARAHQRLAQCAPGL